MKYQIIITLFLSLALTGCLQSDPPGDAETPDDSDGDAAIGKVHLSAGSCEEVFVEVPVEISAVRDRISERYRIIGEDLGVASVVVGFVWCSEGVLNGQPIGDTGSLEVGVRIEAPDGEAGLHVASLFHHFDQPNVTTALGDLGLPVGALVQFEGFLSGDPAAIVAVLDGVATAEHVNGTDSLQTTAVGALRLGPGATNWWAEDKGEAIRMTIMIESVSLWEGAGTLSVGSSTMLAGILGSGSTMVAAGIAVFVGFEMTVERDAIL